MNKTIEKKQVDILFNYKDKNPDLESFNPITNYANIFKKEDHLFRFPVETARHFPPGYRLAACW